MEFYSVSGRIEEKLNPNENTQAVESYQTLGGYKINGTQILGGHNHYFTTHFCKYSKLAQFITILSRESKKEPQCNGGV